MFPRERGNMATFNNRYKVYVDGSIFRAYSRLDIAKIIKQAHDNNAKNISVKDLQNNRFIYKWQSKTLLNK